MSYVSLLKNIPEILGQPTGIAAIASLGIHGAIALIVPLMPVNSSQPKESASPKSVGILELSQADQNRLPQTPGTAPQVALQPQLPLQAQLPLQPQLPTQQQFSQQVPPNLDTQTTTLPPLPLPAYTQPILPPIVTRPDNYRIASSPKELSSQVVPKEDFSFDTSGFNAADQKFTQVPSAPRFNDKEIEVEASKPLPVDRLPALNSAKLPSDLLNAPSPSPVNTPTTSNTVPQTTLPSNDASKVAQNQPLVAPVAKTPKVGDELILARETVPKWQQGSTPVMPDLTTKTSQQALIAQVNSYEDLRKALQQQYPNSQEKAVIRDNISINKPGLEGTVLGFLVVDSEGKVLDIKFQDKSLSPELQAKAREYFNTKAPKADKQTNRYPFSLRFQNNIDNTAEATQEPTPNVVLPKPLSTPGVTTNQPTPAATVKPLPALRIRNDQSAPKPTVTTKPLSTPGANSTQLSPSEESDQKLIEKLRDFREQRKSSDTDK
jgi:hypothetical protein